MPAFSTGVKSEPWEGKPAPASEQAFKKQIKKENPAYVNGKDGWKFFTDYQVENFSQAVGRVTQTTKQREGLGEVARQVGEDRQEGRRPIPRGRRAGELGRLPAEAAHLGPEAARHHLARQADEGAPRAALDRPPRGAAQGGQEARHLRAAGQPLDAVRRLRRLAGDHQVPARDRQGDRRVDVPPITGVGIMENSNEFAANGVPGREAAADLPDLRAAAPGDHDDPPAGRRAGQRRPRLRRPTRSRRR